MKRLLKKIAGLGGGYRRISLGLGRRLEWLKHMPLVTFVKVKLSSRMPRRHDIAYLAEDFGHPLKLQSIKPLPLLQKCRQTLFIPHRPVVAPVGIDRPPVFHKASLSHIVRNVRAPPCIPQGIVVANSAKAQAVF